MFTLSQRFDDEREVEEAEEEHVEFLEPGEDSAEAFESPEEPLDLVACLIESAASGSIVRIAGRQGEGYCRSSIRGNQMNLGVPSAARLADGLGPQSLLDECKETFTCIVKGTDPRRPAPIR